MLSTHEVTHRSLLTQEKPGTNCAVPASISLGRNVPVGNPSFRNSLVSNSRDRLTWRLLLVWEAFQSKLMMRSPMISLHQLEERLLADVRTENRLTRSESFPVLRGSKRSIHRSIEPRKHHL